VVRDVEPLPSGDEQSLHGESAGECVPGGARSGGPVSAGDAKAPDLTITRIISVILDRESSSAPFPALSRHDAPVILSHDA